MTIARAHSNIALIKYWGKRSESLRLPTNSSFSLTLDRLFTDTQVVYEPDLDTDQLILNDKEISGKMLKRVQNFMDLIRQRYGLSQYARINSRNHLPTGAGLASSASAFAALSLAATAAAGIELSPPELSILARIGSGSACRSIYGGFVEWQAGQAEDGSDSYAVPYESAWTANMAVLILERSAKKVASGDGMAQTVKTSPLYPGWLDSVGKDLAAIKAAIQQADLEAVGTIMEHNALKMHATALASQPAVLYWLPETVALIHHVRELRQQGHPCWLTIDAGPNVKVLVPADAENKHPETLKALSQHPSVQELILCQSGPGAYLIQKEHVLA